jgi:actin-like ATPase involved in cell morphogenesis
MVINKLLLKLLQQKIVDFLLIIIFFFFFKELCPAIRKYVESSKLVELERDDWNIELKFEDVKKMFDPVVEKILDAINKHLDACNNDVSAMLLVGGFSESKYLQERIKQRFNRKLQSKISFPERPVTAVVEGGNIYTHTHTLYTLLQY